jgi:hypothetical protein
MGAGGDRSVKRYSRVPQAEALGRAGMFVEEERVIGKNAEFQTGQIGWTRWAIRRDQLKLLEVLSPTAIGIVTYVTVGV